MESLSSLLSFGDREKIGRLAKNQQASGGAHGVKSGGERHDAAYIWGERPGVEVRRFYSGRHSSQAAEVQELGAAGTPEGERYLEQVFNLFHPPMISIMSTSCFFSTDHVLTATCSFCRSSTRRRNRNKERARRPTAARLTPRHLRRPDDRQKREPAPKTRRTSPTFWARRGRK